MKYFFLIISLSIKTLESFYLRQFFSLVPICMNFYVYFLNRSIDFDIRIMNKILFHIE